MSSSSARFAQIPSITRHVGCAIPPGGEANTPACSRTEPQVNRATFGGWGTP
jgi:hypothetical protein